MTIYITLINYGDFAWFYKSTFIHNHKQNTTEHEANRMLSSSVNVYAVKDAKCRSSVYQWHIHTHTCQQTHNVCCADLICSECITGFALQCCSELFDVHLNTTCKVLQSATRQKHQWISAGQQTESHTCTTLQGEDKVNLEAYKIPTIPNLLRKTRSRVKHVQLQAITSCLFWQCSTSHHWPQRSVFEMLLLHSLFFFFFVQE